MHSLKKSGLEIVPVVITGCCTRLVDIFFPLVFDVNATSCVFVILSATRNKLFLDL